MVASMFSEFTIGYGKLEVVDNAVFCGSRMMKDGAEFNPMKKQWQT